MSETERGGRQPRRAWVKPVCFLVAFVVGAWLLTDLAKTLLASGQAGSIELVLNDKKLKFDVPDGKLHYVEMLKHLMASTTPEQRAIRSDVLALLAGTYDTYWFGLPELVDRVGREPDNSEYAMEFVKLVKQRRGPFTMSSLYDLDDPRTVDAIRRLDYDHPLAQALRLEMLSGLANIWPQEHSVTVLFSRAIPSGRAAVCKASEFRGNKVRVFHPLTGGLVKVVGTFPLPREECDSEPNNWLQIGIDDGLNLLDGATLDRKEDAVAKAEPMHQTEEPVTPVLAEAFRSTDATPQ